MAVGRSLHSILRQWAVNRVALSSPELRAWYEAKAEYEILQLLLYYAVCTSNSQLVDRLLDEMGQDWGANTCTSTADTRATPVLALAVVQRC